MLVLYYLKGDMPDFASDCRAHPPAWPVGRPSLSTAFSTEQGRDGTPCDRVGHPVQGTPKVRFFSILPRSYGSTSIPELNQSGSAKQAHGQEEQGAQEAQHAANGDSHYPEWQQNQPNEWIHDQRENSDRPAHQEQDAPKQESNHGFSFLP
jgi:hypothetical protein